MTAAAEKVALGLFPKVAGLAQRLRDSPTLQDAFERHITAKRAQAGFKTSSTKVHLDCRVPTRWNSDFICLNTQVELRREIQGFVTDPEHGLQHYSLTDAQWVLAGDLTEALIIFKEISDRFSQAEVPLVYEVIPMLEDLEHQLDALRNDVTAPAVVRIAAQAALNVVGKYYALTDDCEVYRIAIAMCPDKKMVWFNQNQDWHEDDRVTARQIVIKRWMESYAGEERSSVQSESTSDTVNTEPAKRQRSRWYVAREPLQMSSPVSHDTIQAYLDGPLVSESEINAAGGVLKYWELARATRPRVAQMALDFLSAPVSSVDAERSFSCGRLQVNHLQHNIGSQAFKAQMAIGSWLQTLLLSTEFATKVIQEAAKRTGKGKQTVSTVEVDSDSDVLMVD